MNKYDLEQRYPDLFSEESDQEMYKLVSDLSTAYTKPALPSWLTWATTKARYTEDTIAKRAPALPRRFKPARAFSFSMGTAVALLLVVVTLASASSFALSPQLRDVLGLSGPADKPLQESDFTMLHQVKTINGAKVKLEAAYADAGEIILGQTITQKKQSGKAIYTKLRTKQGQELYESLGTFGADIKSDQFAQSVSYDATDISGNPKQLDLVLDVFVGQEKTTFTFSIPFHGGKVVMPNQSVTSNGTTVTLEKVVIARSGTIFFMKGFAFRPGILPDTELSMRGDAKSYGSAIGITKRSATDPYERIFYGKSLVGKSGNWVLTLKEVVPQVDPNASKNATKFKIDSGDSKKLKLKDDPNIPPTNVKPGTWSFHFTIA